MAGSGTVPLRCPRLSSPDCGSHPTLSRRASINASLSFPPRPHCLAPGKFGSLRSSPHVCNIRLVRLTHRGDGLLRKRIFVVSAQVNRGFDDSDRFTEDTDQGNIAWNQSGIAQDGGDSDDYFSEILGVAAPSERAWEKNRSATSGNRQWVGERGPYKGETKLGSDGYRGRLRDNVGRSETSGASSLQGTHIVGPARTRMASLFEGQPSRLQNKFPVFQRVTDARTLGAGPCREPPVGAFPRKQKRENALYERKENLSSRQKVSKVSSEYTEQASYPSKENMQRDAGNGSTGSNFSTKVQAILGDFKRRRDSSIDERYKTRDASDGVGGANVEDLKPVGSIPQPKAFWNQTEAIALSTGKATQAAEERYSLSFKSPSAVSTSASHQDERKNLPTSFQRASEAGLSSSMFSNASFDLFANASLPFETNQVFSSTSQTDVTSRKGNMVIPSASQDAHVSPRHLSRSIGSRSTPSRSSIPGKFSKYSRRSDLKNRTGDEVRGSRISTAASRPTSMSSLRGSHAQLSSQPNNSVSSAAFSDSDVEDDLKNWGGDELSGSRTSTAISRPSSMSSLPVSDLPFEYQYSYSETPKVAPLGYREPQFSPFGPETMARPWTGRAPLKPSKKKLPEFDSFNPPPRGKKGIKYVQDPGPFPHGKGPREAKSRDEILGEPLSKEEVVELLEKCRRDSRQINLGRDGLTHNMLTLVHEHWKRRRVCKIKCKGVPTVDMDNVCFHLEDKTGGKIILRNGGVVFLFRGRNYNFKDRPRIPLMLWKPAAPVYPRLIEKAAGGLTQEETNELRKIGQKVVPICKLGKNGVYLNLVKDVRDAFKVDDLVRINCQGLNPSDYKKIGAKLKDLVPCVLLSFEREHILMWKGRGNGTALVADDADANVIDMPNLVAPPEIDEVDVVSEVAAPSELVLQKLHNSREDDIESVREEGRDDLYSVGVAALMEVDVVSERAVSTELVLQKLNNSREVDIESVREEGQDELYSVGVAVDVVSEGAVPSELVLQKPNSYREVDFESVREEGQDELYSVGVAVDVVSEGAVQSELVLQQPNSYREADIESVREEGQDELYSVGVAALREVDVVSEGAVPSELVLQKPNNSREANIESVREEGQDELHSVGVAALWEQAIESGMAIELDKTDLDSDSVFETADELAQVAPPGPSYTRSLLNIPGPWDTKPTPDESSETSGGTIRAGRRTKKAAKQVVIPPMVEVPPMGGLPVDELARLLAP